MARWKALPAQLDPAVVEFVGQLRQAKDESGLTLRRLAETTGYSASSWERYLNGRSLPPEAAVRALAASTGADGARLLARRHAALDGWRPPRSAGAEPATGAEPTADPALAAEAMSAPVDDPPPPGRNGSGAGGDRRLLVAAVVSALAGAAIGCLVTWASLGTPASAATGGGPAARQVTYTCDFRRVDGRWYAGNSTTRAEQLEVDMSGPAVAELQCLLQHAGFSPGGVDGNFGPLTESAVIAAQKADHLDVDGRVGPRTWAALRR